MKKIGLGTDFSTVVDGGISAPSNTDLYFYTQGTGTLTLGGSTTSETTAVIDVQKRILSHTVAGITASTTQSQGQGALTADVNEVSTVANTNDTVTLPAASKGSICMVINNGANTLQIFPASGDNLGAGVDTATTLAASNNVTYKSYDATNWV